MVVDICVIMVKSNKKESVRDKAADNKGIWETLNRHSPIINAQKLIDA
jgi:hypothetical protein